MKTELILRTVKKYNSYEEFKRYEPDMYEVSLTRLVKASSRKGESSSRKGEREIKQHNQRKKSTKPRKNASTKPKVAVSMQVKLCYQIRNYFRDKANIIDNDELLEKSVEYYGRTDCYKRNNALYNQLLRKGLLDRCVWKKRVTLGDFLAEG